jgi:hypothetical protein
VCNCVAHCYWKENVHGSQNRVCNCVAHCDWKENVHGSQNRAHHQAKNRSTQDKNELHSSSTHHTDNRNISQEEKATTQQFVSILTPRQAISQASTYFPHVILSAPVTSWCEQKFQLFMSSVTNTTFTWLDRY